MGKTTQNALMTSGNLAGARLATSPDQDLQRYLSEIRQFPMLSEDEEFMLAQRWREYGDENAAHRLVTSHLRLVAKIAMKYRGYGLPLSDLISEGNVGMMQAIKKFEPERGFRLSTYAMWWIRATIHEYILRSWSLVKIGTTAAQKKLFFNLRRLKSKLQAWEENDLSPEHVHEIAEALDVSEEDVIMVNSRIGHGSDSSLNATIGSEAEDGTEWQDQLEDGSQNQEQAFIEKDQVNRRHNMLVEAMQKLSDREQSIIQQRRLSEDPKTLEELSGQFKVTRERVRQIEAKAFTKLQKFMKEAATATLEASSPRTSL